MFPEVSVIIPCYNGENYIGEAIDSALSQTYSNIQVVVVDDGSTDRSKDIIVSYGSKIESSFQENFGACAARNKGLDLSKGDYVKFLDCDDKLVGTAIELEVNVVLENGLDTLAISNSDCFYGDKRWKHWRGDSMMNYRHGFERLVFLLNSMPLVGGALYRKDRLIEIGGFDESLTNHEDVDLFFRYLLGCGSGKFLSTKVVGYLYRDHSGARVSKGGLRRHHQSQKRMLEKHAGLAARVTDPDTGREALSSIARRSWSYGRRSIRASEPVLAEEYFSFARSLGVSNYIAGRKLYKALALSFGPLVAERTSKLISDFSSSLIHYSK